MTVYSMHEQNAIVQSDKLEGKQQHQLSNYLKDLQKTSIVDSSIQENQQSSGRYGLDYRSQWTGDL